MATNFEDLGQLEEIAEGSGGNDDRTGEPEEARLGKEEFFGFAAEGDELFFGDDELGLAFAHFRGFELFDVGFGVDVGFVGLGFFFLNFLDVDKST